VADFRDPWTGIDFYDALPMTALARRADAALERSVLEEARCVVVVSEAMRRQLAERVPAAYRVIQNGFDPDDFEGLAFTPGPEFVLAYVGNLNDARNPEALWRALEALDAPAALPGLRVRFVGNVDPVALDRAAAHGVDAAVDVLPYVAHTEAVRHMVRSTLLLLVINRVPGAEGITTGKLYEYVASGRPVLALGPPGGDAAAVLRDSGAGRMFDYDDAAGVAACIREHYEAWAAGNPLSGADAEGLRPYSRKAQTRALAALLDQMAEDR
jgi:glycosyltransferase involved in cell wall biosynthesis